MGYSLDTLEFRRWRSHQELRANTLTSSYPILSNRHKNCPFAVDGMDCQGKEQVSPTRCRCTQTSIGRFDWIYRRRCEVGQGAEQHQATDFEQYPKIGLDMIWCRGHIEIAQSLALEAA